MTWCAQAPGITQDSIIYRVDFRQGGVPVQARSTIEISMTLAGPGGLLPLVTPWPRSAPGHVHLHAQAH